jgi:hypothetical protein
MAKRGFTEKCVMLRQKRTLYAYSAPFRRKKLLCTRTAAFAMTKNHAPAGQRNFSRRKITTQSYFRTFSRQKITTQPYIRTFPSRNITTRPYFQSFPRRKITIYPYNANFPRRHFRPLRVMGKFSMTENRSSMPMFCSKRSLIIESENTNRFSL